MSDKELNNWLLSDGEMVTTTEMGFTRSEELKTVDMPWSDESGGSNEVSPRILDVTKN